LDRSSGWPDGRVLGAECGCGDVDLAWPLVLAGTQRGTCVGGGEPVGPPAESEVVAQEVGGSYVFGAAADLRGVAVVERAGDWRVRPGAARVLGGGEADFGDHIAGCILAADVVVADADRAVARDRNCGREQQPGRAGNRRG